MSEPLKTYFLEMLQATEFKSSGASKQVEIEVVKPSDGQWNRRLYVEVGQDWFWEDRLEWSAEEWQKYVHSEGVISLRASAEGQDIGYAELSVEKGREVEIKYFGLLPLFVGRGFGGVFLSELVQFIWNFEKVERIWLHTCDNDHQHALTNYLKRGFKTYRVVAGRVGG